MHAEEWIRQRGHGVDVRAQAEGPGLPEQVQAAEGEDTVTLREPVIARDAVRVETGRVDDIARLEQAARRVYAAGAAHPTAVRGASANRDSGSSRAGHTPAPSRAG